MVLSNTAIFEALDDGRLIISPEPQPRISGSDSPKSPFDRTSVDLTLSQFIQRPKENVGANIDFRSGGVADTLNTFFDPHEIDDEQGFILRRNQFILGQTAESVGLPLPRELNPAAAEKGCLAARVEGKSSFARFGLIVHFTAPTIHTGFGPSPIALELMNLGPAPITLYAGMHICQLLLDQVVGIPDMRPGQFDQQESARG
ncbi:MAG: dCTP deaminase [Chloroflexota bacterium]|nr:dCTP deaminase [Chloroflexota bacterium]